VKPTQLSHRGVVRTSAEEWTGKNGLRPDGRFYQYRDYVQAKKLNGWTIGIGHLVRSNESFERGLSADEVLELFHRDLGNVYAAILRNVIFASGQTDFDEQSAFDALTDAGHNLGVGFFTPSNSHPIAALNAGDLEGFCSLSCDGHCLSKQQRAHLQDYNRSGIGFDPNLFDRRKRERTWFFEAAPPPDVTAEELFSDWEKHQILADVAVTLWNETGELLEEEHNAARDAAFNDLLQDPKKT
jgi:GH24 family phage-related lysozyme (muramidase)